MTPARSDPDYLRHQQYGDGANLNARAHLHARFSTNEYGWNRWVFDQFDLPPRAHILELGCGTASLWNENMGRLSAGWTITLSDFSAGMLDEARHNLQENIHQFGFAIIDARAIPFESATFDVVIANHMLYHIPDIPRAIVEIHRVLKAGGHLYATTNGSRHLREIDDLVRRLAPGDAAIFSGSLINRFTFEIGRELIAKCFCSPSLLYYEDALVVTEAEPQVAYVLSCHPEAVQTPQQIAAFTRFVEHEMSATGAILISKDSGMLVAMKK